MELDIYDFDKTLLPFDSGGKFWSYCIRHYPWILSCAPYQFLGLILYCLGIYDLTKLKKPFFSFLTMIPKKKAAEKFWDKYDKYIYDWAKKENRERYSVIVSASPDLIISEIAKRIEIDDYICTIHDKNGAVIGKNCHDAEKVRRFREKYPDAEVINVYSDSIKNDKYIFSLAKHCFHVVKGKRIPFEFKNMYPEG
ncbi:MAG: haloacid dehalogenase-like hydrolase [Clostridiales bacterium]|nr:haloacid dehalogenase-like hydrolase [Clostridiales bacterium]MCD7828577.1 haloacid dehalogenase-like hydrolase [Clostridiales bacterium]